MVIARTLTSAIPTSGVLPAAAATDSIGHLNRVGVAVESVQNVNPVATGRPKLFSTLWTSCRQGMQGTGTLSLRPASPTRSGGHDHRRRPEQRQQAEAQSLDGQPRLQRLGGKSKVL